MKIERCVSCFEVYPQEKLVPMRNDEFQIMANLGETDVKKRFVYHPIYLVSYVCEECYGRIQNKL